MSVRFERTQELEVVQLTFRTLRPVFVGGVFPNLNAVLKMFHLFMQESINVVVQHVSEDA